MRLRKASDNSVYEAKLGDRRIRVCVHPDNVTVRIKRTITPKESAVPKEIKIKGKKTLTLDTICIHAVDKKTAELVFSLTNEGAEALLATLTNWWHDRIEKKTAK